ncbi:MAG: LacI family transcriptional regulator [Oceanotoga sp.]|uniref:LacI family DNA-binding transcriptional regulator n=1 Tax=Oceanotoga sp. TaxID=2108366 RepID=UPI00264E96FE|nr:LacI family DNA-binding transcriptional regulator [Oceanotoga sp.]MDN5343275.1 LacI family transcriptional regulator [Oceanotoga sp.]
MKKNNITIKDIANKAGVSKATVSYVINNKPGVSEKIRNKILKIMKEMNYIPNAIARGLAGKKTHYIGLIIPDISDMFYADIIKGVENKTNSNNYLLNLVTTHAEKAKEKQVIDLFTGGIVDGVIIMAYHINEEYIKILKERNVPFVFIDYPFTTNSVYTVTVDNFDGGYKATEYLIKAGCKKIAFLKGSSVAWDSENRFKGYLKALNDYSIKIDDSIIKDANFRREEGYTKTLEILSNKDIDGVFAANDQMALGAMKAIKEKNLNIPEDISVIGFDNIESSKFSEPTLSTVEQPLCKMGEKSVELLLELIDEKKPKSKKISLKTELIKRKSTK